MSRSRIPLVLILATALAPSSTGAAELLPADRAPSEVIDHYIAARLAEARIEPAHRAADSVLLRRTTLDLAGRIPTGSEARQYVDSTAADKRLQLVDRLLASPDCAFHLRNVFDDMLIPDGRGSDRAWREYLLKAAETGKPWDQMFREMIIGDEQNPEQKGALAYLKARVRSIDDMTNDTSKLFFGVSINCAQCHDHPLVADWKQDHYFGFQAFFSRTFQTKKHGLAEKHYGQVKFKTTAGEEKQAKFMFLTGATVDEPAVERTPEEIKAEDERVKQLMQKDDAPPPTPPAFSPRAKFVELALAPSESPRLARNIVNRTWARLMGYGLVEPLDQMHSSNPPSHPELLDWLTRDLVTHQYDLKRLIRGIVLSEAYARSSRWEGTGDPPTADLFAVTVPRPLSPRQYGTALLFAAQAPASWERDFTADEWRKTRESFDNNAGGIAGQIERVGENFQVSVDEALFFSNSERIQNDLLRDSGDRLVGHLKNLPDRRRQIETAFWAILSRPPADEEIAAFDAYLKERSDRAVPALQQVVWALLTSPEMRFNY